VRAGRTWSKQVVPEMKSWMKGETTAEDAAAAGRASTPRIVKLAQRGKA
jgi:hypothetical protein